MAPESRADLGRVRDRAAGVVYRMDADVTPEDFERAAKRLEFIANETTNVILEEIEAACDEASSLLTAAAAMARDESDPTKVLMSQEADAEREARIAALEEALREYLAAASGGDWSEPRAWQRLIAAEKKARALLASDNREG